MVTMSRLVTELVHDYHLPKLMQHIGHTATAGKTVTSSNTYFEWHEYRSSVTYLGNNTSVACYVFRPLTNLVLACD